MEFWDFGQAIVNTKKNWIFLKLFEAVDMDDRSFPMRCYT
jgi:hypothetical protein